MAPEPGSLAEETENLTALLSKDEDATVMGEAPGSLVSESEDAVDAKSTEVTLEDGDLATRQQQQQQQSSIVAPTLLERIMARTVSRMILVHSVMLSCGIFWGAWNIVGACVTPRHSCARC